MPSDTSAYLGNPNLKASFVDIEFTPEQVKTLVKSATDPKYFIQEYVKIIDVDEGLVPLKLYGYQANMIDMLHLNRFVIAKMPRQSGKSTTILSYLLHFVLFNENVHVGILANKGSTARELLSRLQMAYEYLPKWLQQGIIVWNRGNIELENGSKILAAATSSSSVRGSFFNIIFLDEFAHVEPLAFAESFFNSVYPTISSGETTKVFIVSTPKGMNKFFKMWSDACDGKNDYKTMEINWYDVPGRDEKWKEKTIRNTSEQQWKQEFECEFLGSTDTLISPSKLRNIPIKTPIRSYNNLDVFINSEPEHLYCLIVDTATGIGRDYSAFTVIDVSEIPYRVVAKYRNNTISPMLYPSIIYDVGSKYNNAFVLIEVNINGMQVSDILHYDLEYENLILTTTKQNGQEISGGFTKNAKLGIQTSKQIKRIGCTTLKEMIENDKLIVEDYDIIQEMMTFSQKGNTYQAEEGYKDDLVMTLVLFGWLVQQRYFKEITDVDLREKFLLEKNQSLENDILPFGFINDGINDNDAGLDSYIIPYEKEYYYHDTV